MDNCNWPLLKCIENSFVRLGASEAFANGSKPQRNPPVLDVRVVGGKQRTTARVPVRFCCFFREHQQRLGGCIGTYISIG